MVHGEPQEDGTKVLIAPGTGLGEAVLYWDGERYHALPSEGGHASFAPNSDLEIDLLRYLRTSFLHVSYERVLSGNGLHGIYQFLRDTKRNEPTWFAERLPHRRPAGADRRSRTRGQARYLRPGSGPVRLRPGPRRPGIAP